MGEQLVSEASVYCLKFDLTKSALSSLPKLAEKFREEGAVRVSLLVSAQGAWPAGESVAVKMASDSHWDAISVPSVEGTEFWLVARSRKADLDRALGFAKPSVPIGSFDSREVVGLILKDPLHGQSTKLDPRPAGELNAPSGLETEHAVAAFTVEELERARDHGAIAWVSPAKGVF